MNYELELYLWNATRFYNIGDGEFPRAVIEKMVTEGAIKSPKQAWRTLEKWCDRGWYEFGVTLDLGWRTVREAPFRPHGGVVIGLNSPAAEGEKAAPDG